MKTIDIIKIGIVELKMGLMVILIMIRSVGDEGLISVGSFIRTLEKVPR
jgi:hypothetical protein